MFQLTQYTQAIEKEAQMAQDDLAAIAQAEAKNAGT